MKRYSIGSIIFRWSFLIFISLFSLILLLLTIKAFSGQESVDGPAGPAFTDSFQIQEMPEDWIKKSLTYDAPDAGADIVVTLDGQLHHAWEPIIQKYAGEQNLKIAVTHGTCGLSAGKLTLKSADIGGFCCPPDTTDRLPGLKFHTLGIAAIALFVHPDNPVDNISIEQAQSIFSGEIYRWTDLMAMEGIIKTEQLIQPVGRLHCKLRPGHWRLLLDNEDLFSPSLLEVGAIPDMISQVEINPRAIGYEILWMVSYYQRKSGVKILKINGYSPAESTHVISTNYPLYRVYNVTTWEGKNVENQHAKKLVDHLLHQVEHLDDKFSFIPASRLREAGWKFRGNELVGEPE
jgi:hypothetical protein